MTRRSIRRGLAKAPPRSSRGPWAGDPGHPSSSSPSKAVQRPWHLDARYLDPLPGADPSDSPFGTGGRAALPRSFTRGPDGGPPDRSPRGAPRGSGPVSYTVFQKGAAAYHRMLRLGGGSWTPEESPSSTTIQDLWWEIGTSKAVPAGALRATLATGYFAQQRYLFPVRLSGWKKGDLCFVDDAEWVDQMI